MSKNVSKSNSEQETDKKASPLHPKATPIEALLSKLLKYTPEELSESTVTKEDLELLKMSIRSKRKQSRVKAMLIVTILIQNSQDFAVLLKKFGRSFNNKIFLFNRYWDTGGSRLSRLTNSRKEMSQATVRSLCSSSCLYLSTLWG